MDSDNKQNQFFVCGWPLTEQWICFICSSLCFILLLLLFLYKLISEYGHIYIPTIQKTQ